MLSSSTLLQAGARRGPVSENAAGRRAGQMAVTDGREAFLRVSHAGPPGSQPESPGNGPRALRTALEVHGAIVQRTIVNGYNAY